MFEFTHITLFFICALTSAITAGLGVGGGVFLLALLPNFLAPALVIPIHGATQLMSNASRLVFDRRLIRWDLAIPYLPGALLGGVFGYFMLDSFQFDTLPVILGVFILLVTWSDVVIRLSVIFGNMFLLGIVQTFASLFVGAVGIIIPPILLKRGLSRDETIGTQAVIMTIMHSLKVTTYVAAGFQFFAYWQLMLLMLAGSALGSYGGRYLRAMIHEKKGVVILKWLTTLLALQLIIKYFAPSVFA